MDVTRVEAGFILNGVDYFSALRCMIEPRKSTPYELALGWAVNLKRGRQAPFIGGPALAQEKAMGSKRVFVGLDIDWDEYEALFLEHHLPPEVHGGGWRDAKPVYDLEGRFIGQATSGAWSPLLKKNLAMATVRAPFGEIGTRVLFEVTVEYERRTVSATVVKKPFFDPERKRA
jgi:aminomethyltransferase